jgi:hypothetical protein
MGASHVGPREVRLVAVVGDRRVALCKIAFSRRDASLYLFPYCSGSGYFVGVLDFPAKTTTLTFDFTKGVTCSGTPKLSVHESGQVHIQAGEVRTEKIVNPPLLGMKGEHLATLLVDHLDAALAVTRPLRASGPTQDISLEV